MGEECLRGFGGEHCVVLEPLIVGRLEESALDDLQVVELRVLMGRADDAAVDRGLRDRISLRISRIGNARLTVGTVSMIRSKSVYSMPNFRMIDGRPPPAPAA